MSHETPKARKKCKWCEYATHNPTARTIATRYLCATGSADRALLWSGGYCPDFIRAPGADDDYEPRYTIVGREID